MFECTVPTLEEGAGGLEAGGAAEGELLGDEVAEDALGEGEIDSVAGLDGPAGGGEELVDLGAGFLFGGHSLEAGKDS